MASRNTHIRNEPIDGDVFGEVGLSPSGVRDGPGALPGPTDVEDDQEHGADHRIVHVAVPVRTAYNQWTQFEEFPRFMDGVESVQQLDDTRLRWVAEIGNKREEWDAEITEQNPDQRVAWKANGGKGNAGVVTFHRLDDDETRVTVQMDWEPEGVIENVGTALGFDDRQVSKDLDRFKELIESRGQETGAWRGEV